MGRGEVNEDMEALEEGAVLKIESRNAELSVLENGVDESTVRAMVDGATRRSFTMPGPALKLPTAVLLRPRSHAS